MNKICQHIFCLAVIVFLAVAANGQDSLKPYNPVDTTKPFIPVDSLPVVAETIPDAAQVRAVMRVHSPRKAAIRSAILPGLGQIYNKKYWKVPIVYAALGVSAGVFVYNLNSYRDLRFAYKAKIEAMPSDQNPTPDSANYWKIKAELMPLDPNALRSYRDEFRRNIDYSVIVFILLWGLNIVDATVDAHLKGFDVTPDLGMRFKMGPSKMAGTTGVSLIFAFK
ncbi:MAG: DUF5683 domain-containing protein [Flavisolibacter sp.]